MPKEVRVFCPLGLLAASLVLDAASRATGSTHLATASYLMLSAGVAGTLLSLLLTPLCRIGVWRGTGNVMVSVLYIWSWFLRREDQAPSGDAIMLSVLGFTLAVVTGWLCGELAFRYRIRERTSQQPAHLL